MAKRYSAGRPNTGCDPFRVECLLGGTNAKGCDPFGVECDHSISDTALDPEGVTAIRKMPPCRHDPEGVAAAVPREG